MRKLHHRLIGLLIIIKTLILPAILLIFCAAFFFITSETRTILSTSHQNISIHLNQLDGEITALKAEVLNFKNKIEAARTDVTKFSNDVERAVRPITASLKGIQSILKSVLGSIAGALNGVIDGLRKVSFGAIKIPKISLAGLKNLNLVPIDFPDLNVDFSIDTQSLQEIQRISEQITVEVDTAVTDLQNLYWRWMKIILVAFLLVFIWLFISLLGFFLRIGSALRVGFKMLRGQQVENALFYL